MIVNYTAEGWEVITQRAHGLLAAQIADQYNHRIRIERWVETLLAIAEHDDAQTELDQDGLLTPKGGPLDFKMKGFDLDHCLRTAKASLSKSRYIALLTSLHLDFLFREKCASDKSGKGFLKEQTILRKVWHRELGITKKQAKLDYRLLEWCDALSLLICQRENQPEARRIEISEGPEMRAYVLIQAGPNTLTVQPWPFEVSEFKVYYEARTMPALSFKTDNEFRIAFIEAMVKIKQWNFKKTE